MITNNIVNLTGIIESEPEFSHEILGEGFYTFMLNCARKSGSKDILPVMVSDRLVDINKIQENGSINDKSLEDEINAVIAEFPELKNAKEEEKEEKGFKFGATEGTSNSNQTQKRPVATKRWNRFNSF